MITHFIHKYNPSPPSKPVHITQRLKEKYKGILGTDDHKKFIFVRAIRDCPFKAGDQVVYKRQTCKVTEVYGEDDFKYINWNGLAPNFVELWSEYGEVFLVNPGSIKKYRK